MFGAWHPIKTERLSANPRIERLCSQRTAVEQDAYASDETRYASFIAYWKELLSYVKGGSDCIVQPSHTSFASRCNSSSSSSQSKSRSLPLLSWNVTSNFPTASINIEIILTAASLIRLAERSAKPEKLAQAVGISRTAQNICREWIPAEEGVLERLQYLNVTIDFFSEKAVNCKIMATKIFLESYFDLEKFGYTMTRRKICDSGFLAAADTLRKCETTKNQRGWEPEGKMIRRVLIALIASAENRRDICKVYCDKVLSGTAFEKSPFFQKCKIIAAIYQFEKPAEENDRKSFIRELVPTQFSIDRFL